MPKGSSIYDKLYYVRLNMIFHYSCLETQAVLLHIMSTRTHTRAARSHKPIQSLVFRMYVLEREIRGIAESEMN